MQAKQNFLIATLFLLAFVVCGQNEAEAQSTDKTKNPAGKFEVVMEDDDDDEGDGTFELCAHATQQQCQKISTEICVQMPIAYQNLTGATRQNFCACLAEEQVGKMTTAEYRKAQEDEVFAAEIIKKIFEAMKKNQRYQPTAAEQQRLDAGKAKNEQLTRRNENACMKKLNVTVKSAFDNPFQSK